ncbi:unnamed protein product [Prorocentrum cordatum]|uniref:DUF1330 domain-containing protein n=1 Tax=Prorocentrum cordatum TaxID=2364126 RepID=A0ABN9WD43_9DINO|nr:unnamed protein product [Polarella glacialis]
MGCCMSSRQALAPEDQQESDAQAQSQKAPVDQQQQEKKGYVYGFIDVKDPEEFENVYSPMVEPTLEPYGGKLILKHALTPQMAGKMRMKVSKGFGTTGQWAFMLQFDTFEKAMGWFMGPEYAAVTEKRDQVADFKMAVVEGTPIQAGSGLVVGFFDMKKPEEFEDVYNPMVEPSLDPYGGKFAVKHALVPTMAAKMGMKETKGFGATGQVAFVLQFADFEKAMGWFTGPEYTSVIEKRDEVADFKMAVVESIQESFDLTRYTDAESLFDALAFSVEGLHPVRLVRMSWLLQQRGTVLKRRQELPDEAFVTADELRAVWEASGRGGRDHVAPIITISFCWDSREHPDPKGLQLSLVIDTLEHEFEKYSKAYGKFLGFSEMGVFWDWPSLLQGDPDKVREAKAAALQQGKSDDDAQAAADEAKRTPAEKAAFKHGLQETMDLWYAHQATTVFLLTQHPRERGSARECGYDQSGWTTYERCSAEQIKQVFRYDAHWNAVADLGQGLGATKAGRGWPLGPDEFDRLIEDRSFTNGADREAVKALFRRMSRAQLGGVTTLDFDGMPPPTPEQAAGLAGCLRLCARLEELDLGNCRIGPAGARALAGALPSMPRLEALDLPRHDIGDDGAQALAGALPSMTGLKELVLGGNGIGNGGAQALAGALRSMPGLQTLILYNNNIGDGGAQALAKVLPSATGLKKLDLYSNGISRDGQAALRAAWGSRGGNLNV